MKDRHRVWKHVAIVSALVGVVAVVGVAYYIGFSNGFQQTRHIVVEGVSNPTSPSTANFGTFWDVWNLLKQNSVFKNKVQDNQSLVNGAISGMVSSIGDPYTVFFPPQEAKDFTQEISGQFGGIGAEIGTDANNQIIVIAPLKGTPAESAGILAGDQILKIGATSTAELSVEEAVNEIRGPVGTPVTLVILHQGEKTPHTVTIIRATIQVPTLDLEFLNNAGKQDPQGKIAYVKLYNFYEQSASLFQQAAMQALAAHAQGMIIDLRNNPGGYLDAATSISGWFVPKGKLIVQEQFQDPTKTQKYLSSGPALFAGMPVVVIINRGSASASEILTGALKESDGATVIGEKSFGKGTVQEVMPLNDGSMVKITIAHWLTPDGHMIDKNGIMPDIALTVDTSTASTTPTYGNDIDAWVQRAVQVLQQNSSGN